MNYELIFKACFGVLFLSAVLVTLFNQRRAGNYSAGVASHARSHAQHEAKGLLVIRGSLALLWYPTVLAWLFAPRWIPWSFVKLPETARWAGFGLGTKLTVENFAMISGVLLLFLSQQAMGANFAPTLEMKTNHHLVKRGPYRWVRHPMYLAFLLMISGAGILAANWLMELTGVLLIVFIMILRIPKEEALLGERFGEDYSEYKKKTPPLMAST